MIAYDRIYHILRGLLASTLLAALCHALGAASGDHTPGYEYTEYFTHCISWPFAVAYLAVGVALGEIVKLPVASAVGMMLPLPAACLIEVILRPSHHNLWPLEAVFLWLPAYGVALLGTKGGKTLVTRIKRKKEPPKPEYGEDDGEP